MNTNSTTNSNANKSPTPVPQKEGANRPGEVTKDKDSKSAQTDAQKSDQKSTDTQKPKEGVMPQSAPARDQGESAPHKA